MKNKLTLYKFHGNESYFQEKLNKIHESMAHLSKIINLDLNNYSKHLIPVKKKIIISTFSEMNLHFVKHIISPLFYIYLGFL